MHILFDLDGTLTNPHEGITACIRHAFSGLQIPAPDSSELAQWIGPPLHDSFLAVLNCPEQATQAVQIYRDRFATVGLYENELYEGIPEMLADLKAQGYSLWVATSKPQIFARKIIQHFGLQPLFAGVYGSELNGDRARKGDLIAHILTHENIDAQAAVMVGDRHYDIAGAQQNGMGAIGVTWGFGTEEELTEAGAQGLCPAPQELINQARVLLPLRPSETAAL
jgi:phosphoglycolate phosphatase